MTEQSTRSNLGRGLSALFGEEGSDYASLDRVRSSKEVPIEQLHPNPKQPRQSFDDTALQELADSIKENGLLQPILVRRHAERTAEYEIVAGERRWRAAQIAKLHSVPVVIRELTDSQALEVALVENLQRQDLSALEEAEAYKRLVDEFHNSQDDLGRAVGKSRSHVANSLRLLGLPEPVKELLRKGDLTAGHARALLTADNPEAVAREVVKKQLNVRQTERLVQHAKEGAKPRAAGKSGAAQVKDSDTLALEHDLSSLLGMRVNIEIRGQGGALTIHYQSLEQLDDLLRRLNQGAAGGD
ncbi:MAG: ParB/RepB/Spo0J family partition protein [Kiloniellales bacterium]